MIENKTLLCFEGVLQENLVFEPGRGMETTRIPSRPAEGHGPYAIELRNEEGKTIVQITPPVDFDDACFTTTPTMRATWVMAYIPYHPDARQLVFRRDDYVIYETPVATQRPRVEIDVIEFDRESVSIQWRAEHSEDLPLTFNVFCIVDGRVVMLAQDLENYKGKFELDRVPGGDCRVAVVVTDGLRSSHAVSDSFTIAEKQPDLWIISPREGAVYPPDQPINLIGQAVDLLSIKQPEKGLVWEIDDTIVRQDTSIAPAIGLTPGAHVATLSWQSESYKTVRASVKFSIADYNEAQLRYRELMGLNR
jgi:hypothetical protein